MNVPALKINSEDEAAIALKELYGQYGYKPYKMSKFESYELYAQNKNFLVSDNVITFTDLKGKLMALRPDVTLSIIKNYKPSAGTQKLFYRENVYRTDKNVNDIREILQIGLECVGDIYEYETCEVLSLAAKSLESVSERYIIDISHMGFLRGLLAMSGAGRKAECEIIKCIKEKNTHDIYKICAETGIQSDSARKIAQSASLSGTFTEIIPRLKELIANEEMRGAVSELTEIYEYLKTAGCEEHFRIDLSVVHDIDYYDKIVFSGFIDGIPVNVLSGGRYDRLLERFGKKAGAIGFAVYLGILMQYANNRQEQEVDIILCYSQESDINTVIEAVREYTENKKKTMVVRQNGFTSAREFSDRYAHEHELDIQAGGAGIYYVNGRELVRLC